MWKWKYETTLFYVNKYFYGKCFFSSTCSSNSVDVDDNYVVDGDDDVSDTDGDE